MSTSKVLVSVVLLLSIATATAFDITQVLSKNQDYYLFNLLLKKTKLAQEINSRNTVTVLVVHNKKMGELNAMPEDVQKKILSNHVILDFYDSQKLKELKTDTKTQLTTLFQASGNAGEQLGFINVINKNDGAIVFGSAVKDAPIDSELETSILYQPYNISVLGISKPIIAPGIANVKPVEGSSPKAAPAAATTAPAASPAKEETTSSSASASPSASPIASASAPAPAGASAAPTVSPVSSPKADAPVADASGAVKMVSGVSLGLVLAFASFIAA